MMLSFLKSFRLNLLLLILMCLLLSFIWNVAVAFLFLTFNPYSIQSVT